VVIAIVLVIVAMAAPTMTTWLTSAKSRGEVSQLSGIFQTCRSHAIKNNATEELNFTNSALTRGLTVAYIYNFDNPIVKVNGVDVDTSVLHLGQDAESAFSQQRQVWMFSHFIKVSAPTGTNPPPLTGGSMWGGTSTTPPDTTDNLCFNSRGIPCTCPSTRPNYCPGITNGYAFYFTQGTQWAAVGVSPAGRIKTYFWNGGAWAN